MPSGAGARDAVDEGYTLGLEPGEVTLQVVGAVRDVVQARAPSLEETADGGVRTERLEQLQGAYEGDADALGLEGFGSGAGGTGEQLERVSALFDGVDGDANVVD